MVGVVAQSVEWSLLTPVAVRGLNPVISKCYRNDEYKENMNLQIWSLHQIHAFVNWFLIGKVLLLLWCTGSGRHCHRGRKLTSFEFTPASTTGSTTLTTITLIYFVKGSITVQLTSCLTGFDSAALLMFNQQQIYLFGWIQISQIGGQLYSDTSPYKVSECSLPIL